MTKYVDAFHYLVTPAREYDGCTQIAVMADSVDLERIDSI